MSRPGTFQKGDSRINREGRKASVIDVLKSALEAEGVKRGKDFWAYLAEQAFEDRQVLIAVAKKFIPDMSKTEIEGSMEVHQMGSIEFDGIPLRPLIGEN